MNLSDTNNTQDTGFNKKQSVTADDQVRQFFSARETAPVFDQAKADRLQRMSKINGIGRALNVLADIGGTAMGANVRQRTLDQNSPSLFNRYLDMMDKYKSDTDSWKYRDYQKTLQNAQLGIQRADKEDAMEMARQKQADWMKAKTADRQLNYAKWSADWEQKAGDSQERSRHNKAMENAALIRANKTGNNLKNKDSNKADKSFVIFDDNGDEIARIPDGMEGRVLKEILNDPKITSLKSKDMNLLLASRGRGLTRQNIRNIISYYYDKSPNAMKMLGLLNEPEPQGKIKPGAFDYSKLFYPNAGPDQQQPTSSPDNVKKFKGVPQGGF